MRCSANGTLLPDPDSTNRAVCTTAAVKPLKRRSKHGGNDSVPDDPAWSSARRIRFLLASRWHATAPAKRRTSSHRKLQVHCTTHLHGGTAHCGDPVVCTCMSTYGSCAIMTFGVFLLPILAPGNTMTQVCKTASATLCNYNVVLPVCDSTEYVWRQVPKHGCNGDTAGHKLTPCCKAIKQLYSVERLNP